MAALAPMLLSALVGATDAASIAEAKRLYAEGERQYKLARFELALEAFSRAYAVAALPELLFNMAQCHMELGQYARATFLYESLLARTRRARGALLGA